MLGDKSNQNILKTDNREAEITGEALIERIRRKEIYGKTRKLESSSSTPLPAPALMWAPH